MNLIPVQAGYDTAYMAIYSLWRRARYQVLRTVKDTPPKEYIRDDYSPAYLAVMLTTAAVVGPRQQTMPDDLDLGLVREFRKCFLEGGLSAQRAIWHVRRERQGRYRDTHGMR